MGLFVIAVYRAKPGKESQLMQVLRDHMPILRSQNLITDRPAYFMRAKDGSIIEVFEWKSEQAVDHAHENALVQKLWQRFEECCEYHSLDRLGEAKTPFANFESLEIEQ